MEMVVVNFDFLLVICLLIIMRVCSWLLLWLGRLLVRFTWKVVLLFLYLLIRRLLRLMWWLLISWVLRMRSIWRVSLFCWRWVVRIWLVCRCRCRLCSLRTSAGLCMVRLVITCCRLDTVVTVLMCRLSDL